ncbi:hypothetical protein GQ53DRAFT_747065 [Thozetella sp. PMI_491]|nr:hypothetical protein GQ53DRAFT_747065 [Thozetella sp. PMI_491]
MPRKFSTPRKSRGFTPRGARATPGSGPDRLNGYFRDGQWTCNCEPRQLAVLLPVKKNNANKGRRFYTCPNERRSQCNFFLWKEDADAREKGAVLSDSHTETTYAIGTPSPAQTPANAGATADNRSALKPVQRLLFASAKPRIGPEVTEALGRPIGAERVAPGVVGKRKRVAFAADDGENGSTTDREEFSDGVELNSDDEGQLFMLADDSAKKSRLGGNTLEPSGLPFLTPTVQRSHDASGGIPTPVSHRHSSTARPEQSSAKRQRTEFVRSTTPTSYISGPGDGSPMSSPTTRGSQGPTPLEITDEIMGLIPTGAVTETIRRQIKDRLDVFGLKAKGLERGRDIAREEIKKKAAEVEVLEGRLEELMIEGRKDKETIARLRAAVTALAGGD